MKNKTDILKVRQKQPGHDRTFKKSETQLENVLIGSIEPTIFHVETQPKDLLHIFKNTKNIPNAKASYGIRPELLIRCRSNNKPLYIEVKKQGKGGNAEERACKHHTIQFQKILRQHLQIDYNPIVTIFCEKLATQGKYLVKHAGYFEEGTYFCWPDYDDTQVLLNFIEKKIRQNIYFENESVFVPNV
jgi:hypothetical protein